MSAENVERFANYARERAEIFRTTVTDTTPDTTSWRALADHAEATNNPVLLAPATVRALCDGYDDAQRLRGTVAERDLRLAETIRYHDERVNRADAATDAARQALADLIGELRALIDGDGPPVWSGSVRAIIDRHAPEDKS